MRISENNIEQLLRHHVRTMGMDIELARRFGTFDMKAVIRERGLPATDCENHRSSQERCLEKQMKADQGYPSCDGSQGQLAPHDPHAVSSRLRARSRVHVHGQVTGPSA